jgi:hypothetical protein
VTQSAQVKQWSVSRYDCQRPNFGRLAQLVARFLHTEEVIGSSPVSPTMTDNPYEQLRSTALSVEPGSIGITPTGDLPHVFGVVMDIGMDRGTATLVAFADGAVSLYYSSGGGIIGAGQHEQVRSSAHRLLAIANSDLASFSLSLPDALPQDQFTQLTLRSFDGALRATALSSDFGYDRVPGGLVFRAAHDVISQLRELNP